MAILLVAMTFLASCIDNEVAPEVTALRQAQVDLLNAKKTMQDLQNEAQQILNDYQSAINALALQEAEAELGLALAEIDVALEEAAADLAAAELAHEEALQDLVDYLNTQGLEQAATYLANYSSYMSGGDVNDLDGNLIATVTDGYYDLLYDIAAQEAAIAEWNLMLATTDNPNCAYAEDIDGDEVSCDDASATYCEDADGNEIPCGSISYALAAQMIARDLAETQFELDAANEVLTALQAVQADPSAWVTEYAAASAQVETLSNQNNEISNTMEDFEQATVAAAWDAWAMAVGGYSYYSLTVELDDEDEPGDGWLDFFTIDDPLWYDGVIPTYEEAYNDVMNYQVIIDNNTDWIADEEELIALQESYVAVFEADLAEAETLAEGYQTDYDAADADVDAALLAWWEVYSDLLVAAEQEFTNNSEASDFLDAIWDLDYATAFHAIAIDERDDAEANLVTVQADYDANYTTAETAWLDALDDVTDADAILNGGFDSNGVDQSPGALADYDADPTSTNLTALNTARTNYDNAVDAANVAFAVVNGYDQDLSDAEDWVDDARDAIWNDDGDGIFETNGDDSGTAVDLDIAQSNYDNIVNDDPAFYASIETALATLFTDYYTAEADYYAAVEVRDAAEDLLDSALGLVEDIEDELWDDDGDGVLETNGDDSGYYVWIADNEEDIANYMSNIEDATLDMEEAQAIVDELQAEYDALDIATLEALDDTFDDVLEDYFDMGDEYNANAAMINAYMELMEVLEGNIENVNPIIEGLLDEIESLDASVEHLTKMLEDNAISEAEYMEQIAAEEAELARLEAEAAAILALADEYYALYQASIGG